MTAQRRRKERMSEYIVVKDGTEMKTMTKVEMTWSTIVFFLSAAQMPKPMPAGTEIRTDQTLTLIVVGRRSPMMTIASTFGEM
jgi:hypothetical protein